MDSYTRSPILKTSPRAARRSRAMRRRRIRTLAGVMTHAFLERLKAISGPHGTSVVLEGDVARIVP